MDHSPPARPARRALAAMLGVVFALGLAAKLLWGYRADELQHLHVAANLARGLLPYRDFFEHHPPVFHLLLIPLIRLHPRLDGAFLAVSTLGALLIAAATAALYYRLLRRSLEPLAATFGLVAWLLVPPYPIKVFELRPDWLALAGVLAALLCLLRSLDPATRRPLGWALLAGVLAGGSLCLTQKLGVVLLGIGAWLAGTILLAPDPLARRRRLAALAGLAAGGALPLLALLGFFALHGALALLVEHTLLLNLRWAREIGWQFGLQDALAGALGLLALGLVEAAQRLRQLRAGLRTADPATLLALLSVLGLAAYLRTPAPYPQWWLLLVTPWLATLGALAISRYASDPGALGRDRWPLLAALALGGAALWSTLYRPVPLVWALIALLVAWRWPRLSDARRRIVLLFTPTLVCGGLYLLVSLALAAAFQPRTAQARLEATVASAAAPDEPILSASWPIVAPLRAYPVRRWLVHQGVLETLPAQRAAIEDEYIAALRTGRARLIALSPRLVDRYLPRLGQYVRTHCAPLPPAAPNPGTIELYQSCQ